MTRGMGTPDRETRVYAAFPAVSVLDTTRTDAAPFALGLGFGLCFS
jgi:hypothetical protein